MKTKYILLFEKFLELDLDPEIDIFMDELSLGVIKIPDWTIY
jgi:hypothetical protein